MNAMRVVQLLSTAKEKGEKVRISLNGGEVYNDISIEQVTDRGEVIGKRMADAPTYNFCYFDASDISCISTESGIPIH